MLEILLIWGIFFWARELRSSTDMILGISLPTQTISLSSTFLYACLGTLIYVSSMWLHGLYSIDRSGSFLGVFGRVFRAWFVGFFVYVGCLYFTNEMLFAESLPRLLLIFHVVLSVFGVLIYRGLVQWLRHL